MNRIYTVGSSNYKNDKKEDYMIANMSHNLAYKLSLENTTHLDDREHLEHLTSVYKLYRSLWRHQCEIFTDDIKPNATNSLRLLCVDIETASICDLACPHCYRQYEATPDKVINFDLAISIIDQAAEMSVPSIKFNWRGEPLLNKDLPDLIHYAKSRGILETIINTNATRLDAITSQRLIECGLDVLIFSFDGGTKETYEKMRPGRFHKNHFEDVLNNIKRFHDIRKKSGSLFPFTRIQLVVTQETQPEVQIFKSLFDDIVDDVTTKQYTERGGNLHDMSEQDIANIGDHVSPTDYILKTHDGTYYKSVGRLPCEQPYQRLLVTYDGRVGMCCYDWGARHPVGYVSENAWVHGPSDLEKTLQLSKGVAPAFDLLKNIRQPLTYNEPNLMVNTLTEIWSGYEISRVRKAHANGNHSDVEICRKCPFKDTYNWVEINHK
jgi:MoaA/NifB/PqqE/SkfB family radical SAM enzyme